MLIWFFLLVRWVSPVVLLISSLVMGNSNQRYNYITHNDNDNNDNKSTSRTWLTQVLADPSAACTSDVECGFWPCVYCWMCCWRGSGSAADQFPLISSINYLICLFIFPPKIKCENLHCHFCGRRRQSCERRFQMFLYGSAVFLWWFSRVFLLFPQWFNRVFPQWFSRVFPQWFNRVVQPCVSPVVQSCVSAMCFSSGFSRVFPQWFSRVFPQWFSRVFSVCVPSGSAVCFPNLKTHLQNNKVIHLVLLLT
jgi:hypothetical protein